MRLFQSITRIFGLSNRSNQCDVTDPAEPSTVPAERLWVTYKMAVQDVFRDRPIDVWSVENEGMQGETFRKVGDAHGFLAALHLVRNHGLELADEAEDMADATGEPSEADEPNTTPTTPPSLVYLLNATNGDVIARAIVDPITATATVIAWIDPLLLDKHRRISRITRAVLQEQAAEKLRRKST